MTLCLEEANLFLLWEIQYGIQLDYLEYLELIRRTQGNFLVLVRG